MRQPWIPRAAILLLAAATALSSGCSRSTEPTARGWTNEASMPTARNFLADGVINGVLYAVGGADVHEAAAATVEAYDPATNTWTANAAMPTARYGLAGGVVNGALYAVGGWDGSATLTTVEAYTP